MANLVVCADGTWNTPADMEGGLPAVTNVFKFYNALADTDDHGEKQLKYYHPGVGTDGSRLRRFLGGATGTGLSSNVKSGYKWLAVNYRNDNERNDKIYLVGFSRGAYTVRSLAGMASYFGLLDLSDLPEDEVWKRVDTAFSCYRARKEKKTAPEALKFHNLSEEREIGKGTTPIDFLGVWDTVGALGIPDDLGLLNLFDNPHRHDFHDTELGDNVLNARHAVAIDEMRQSFSPTLWTKTQGREDRIKQLWFPGVHSDVGGGYAHSGLSDAALDWMIGEAQGCGLSFREKARNQLSPHYQGLLHDSLRGVFGKLKTRPRNVPLIPKDSPHLHQSVLSRTGDPPLHETSYRPSRTPNDEEPEITLDVFAREKWNATGIYLNAGTEYSFRASGQWLDSSIPSGPNGSEDGTFSFGKIFLAISSGLGKLEGIYRERTKNKIADFWFTKRVEEFPWFSLVGVIANSEGADPEGNLIPHETFLIGSVRNYKPEKSGYLYCFANDAWQTYGNNKGSVRLTVKRTLSAPATR